MAAAYEREATGIDRSHPSAFGAQTAARIRPNLEGVAGWRIPDQDAVLPRRI